MNSLFKLTHIARLAPLCLMLMVQEAVAVPLEMFATAWRQTAASSRFFPAYDVQVVLAAVSPNPLQNPGVGDATSVTAAQNGSTFDLGYLNSPAFPTNYTAIFGYDPTFTGDWTVTATNNDPAIDGENSITEPLRLFWRPFFVSHAASA